MLICARGVVGSKIGSDEEKTSMIWKMGCDCVLDLRLGGACYRFC